MHAIFHKATNLEEWQAPIDFVVGGLNKRGYSTAFGFNLQVARLRQEFCLRPCGFLNDR